MEEVSDCPKCGCEGMFVRVLKEFQHCRECKFIISSNPKVIRIGSHKFGLANKNIDEAIERLQELKKRVPEGASSSIYRDYNGDNYLRVNRHESEEELHERMRKAKRQFEANQLRKNQEEQRRKQLEAQRKAELEERKKRQQEADKKASEKKAYLSKEKEKIEKLFKSQGISLETLKEILVENI